MESIELSSVFPATASNLYQAWLSSSKHTAFTGGDATIEAKVGGKFTAWDGYITGETVVLEPETRIVQKWRTSEFGEFDEDSELEILFEDVEEGSRITLIHTHIPVGQGEKYRVGWENHYFTPMRDFFV